MELATGGAWQMMVCVVYFDGTCGLSQTSFCGQIYANTFIYEKVKVLPSSISLNFLCGILQ